MTTHAKKKWATPTVVSVAQMSAAEAKQSGNGEGVLDVGGVSVTTGPGS